MTSTLPRSTTAAGRLTGRVALVTGAGRGIGQALAVRLAAEGARIAVVDLADTSQTLSAVEAAGGTARAFAADVSEPDQVHGLVSALADDVGAPDIIVNNAGIYPFIKLDEITISQWRHVFAVNVESQLLTAQAFAPAMKERGWGRIINVTSNSVGLQIPDAVHYVASKMAVIGLTRGLATELAPFGVTVNAIAPSATRTPGMSFATEELLQGVASQQTIKRIEQPEDLAGAVVFLASPDSDFITAQTLFVDGGLVRT